MSIVSVIVSTNFINNIALIHSLNYLSNALICPLCCIIGITGICTNQLLKCNLRKEERKRVEREEKGRKELIVEGLLEKSMCRIQQSLSKMVCVSEISVLREVG